MKVQKLMENVAKTYARPNQSINKYYSNNTYKESSLYKKIGKAVGIEVMRKGLFLSYLLIVPAIFGLIGRITEKTPDKQQSDRIDNLVSRKGSNSHKNKELQNSDQAKKKGHTKTRRALIGAGVRVNLKDRIGQTPLHEAAEKGHTKTAETLIESGINLDTQGIDGCTPLHKAAQFGRTEIVKALIEAGVSLSTQANDGNTALHFAADNGHKEIVKALIEARAEVNVKDIKGDTPLHKATLRGFTEIVRDLMLERADPDIKNNFDLTPFDYASLHSSLDTFTKQQELRLKKNKD